MARTKQKLHISRGATHARAQFQEAKHKRDTSGKFADMPGSTVPGADGSGLTGGSLTPASKADWQAVAKTSQVGNDDVIKMHVSSNPKKPGSMSAERLGHYQDGMTVGDFKAAGGRPDDLAYDRKKGYVTFHDSATYKKLSTAGASPVSQINPATATGRLATIKVEKELSATTTTHKPMPPEPTVPLKATGDPPAPPPNVTPDGQMKAPDASKAKPGTTPAPKAENAPTAPPTIKGLADDDVLVLGKGQGTMLGKHAKNQMALPASAGMEKNWDANLASGKWKVQGSTYKPAPKVAPTPDVPAHTDDTMIKHWAYNKPMTVAQYKAKLPTVTDEQIKAGIAKGDIKLTTDAPPVPPKSAAPAEKGTLTFKKGEAVSDVPLNGVPLKSWTPPKDSAGWKKVEGQMEGLVEPPLPTSGKVSSGVLIREKDGSVWLAKPTNEFGGYKHTFPKGTIEKGEGLSAQANAIKEAYEETGLQVKITGYAGDFKGDTGITRYYHAERVGGSPLDHGWESEAVVLAPPGKLGGLLNKQRDLDIAAKHVPPTLDDRLEATEVSIKTQTPKTFTNDNDRWAAAHGIKGETLETASPGQNWDIDGPPMTKAQITEMMDVRTATGLKYVSGAKNRVVDDYTEDGHSIINDGLRKGGFDSMSPKLKKSVGELDGLMKEATSDVTVWRGLQSEDPATDLLNKMPPPKEFTDMGFGSTSINPATAHNFAGVDASDTPVVFKIRLPKGTKAASIGRPPDERGGIMDEAELLVGRGARYKYIGTLENQKVAGADGVKVVELEVVSNNGAPVIHKVTLPTQKPDDHRYKSTDLVDMPQHKVVDENDKGLEWEYSKEYHQYGGHSWVQGKGGDTIKSQTDFNKRYKDAPLTYLTDDQYNNLGYTSINMNKLPTFAEKAPGLKARKRDPEAIRGRMLDPDGQTAPPIVLRHNGELRLMAGQSRIWIGLASGYRVPMKVIDV